MGVDPFAALGIEAPKASPVGDMPTMTVRPEGSAPKSSGVDPLSALGVEGGQTFAPTQVAKPQSPSLMQSIGAGLTDVGANLINTLSNPGANLIGKPLATGLVFAHDAIAPMLGGQRFPDDVRNMLLEDNVPQPGQQINTAIARGIGAPDPAELPQTLPRKMVGAAGSAAALSPAGAGVALPGAIGAGGALTGDLAARLVPEWAQPMTELTGNILGGLATGVGAYGAQKVAGKVGNTLGMYGIGRKEDINGVRATGAQVNAAGQRLETALGPEGADQLRAAGAAEMQARALEAKLQDPAITPAERVAVQRELNALQPQREQLVPGLQPTTAQLAPTTGAVALEHGARLADREAFAERGTANNAAMTQAVQGMAPQGTGPAAVADMFLQQLDALDQRHAQAVTDAENGVVTRTQGVGEAPAQTYGAQMRGALQTALEPVHKATQALWRRVDPNGEWTLSVTPLQEAAAQVYADRSPTSPSIEGETALIDRARGLPSAVSFKELSDIRKDINAYMAKATGTPGSEPSIRRLTILKQAVDQSIRDAVEHVAGEDAGVVDRLSASWQEQNGQTGSGGGGGAGVQTGVDKAGTAAGSFARDGGQGQGARGPEGAGSPGRVASGASDAVGARPATAHLPADLTELERGIYADLGQEPAPPRQPLTPNITPENAAAYRAAVNATREEKQRFGQGGVGEVLRPGRNYEDWKVAEGNVPTKIFTRGNMEPGEVERFITAVGGADKAAQIGESVLTAELRDRGIIGLDGTINATKFAGWLRQRAPTIEQFPGLMDKFRDWQTAQTTLDQARSRQVTELRDFQNGVARNFLKMDPEAAVASMFKGGNSAGVARQLYDAVRNNPDALDGLKRGVIDHLDRRFNFDLAAEEAGTTIKSKAFRDYLKEHKNALKIIFGGQGYQTIEMVAAGLERQARATQKEATVGSNTVPKAIAAAKHGAAAVGGGATTALFAIIGERLMENLAHITVGHGVLAPVASVAGVAGGLYLNALRQAGIRTMNDLTREMMLHPDLARTLLQRVDAQKAQSAVMQRRVAAAIQGAIASDLATNRREQRQ